MTEYGGGELKLTLLFILMTSVYKVDALSVVLRPIHRKNTKLTLL